LQRSFPGDRHRQNERIQRRMIEPRAQAGAYPDLPEVAPCQRTGSVSVRPRNRRRNGSTRSLRESADCSEGSATPSLVPASAARRRAFSQRSRVSSAWRARTSID
jgi:hypothetical protein